MKIDELREAASKHGHMIYNICFREMGVGVQFYDPKRVRSRVNEYMTPRDRKIQEKQMIDEGLYLNAYHASVDEAIEYEIQRLLKDEI